jgi:hypothetical protein
MTESNVLDYLKGGERKRGSSHTAYLFLRSLAKDADSMSDYTRQMQGSLGWGSHAENQRFLFFFGGCYDVSTGKQVTTF